jgi:hypothetical protein
MPSDAEIGNIEVEFAAKYGLDLAGIKSDTARLKELATQHGQNNDAAAYTYFTYNGGQAFVPNLEVTAFADVAADQRLNSKRVELNLDDAIRYCQACLQLREQYANLAKLRNDTRFKGEEFVRLDAVHQQEVQAGLYRLPWQEAYDERVGLDTALAEATIQQKTTEEMMNSSASGKRYSAVLSEARIKENVYTNAFITRQVANDKKDQVEVQARVTGDYRSGIELATWEESLSGTKANVAQLKARLAVASRKEEYFRKDEGFKSQRAAISRQLAWLQISEHCRRGSELNFDEKLQKLGVLFDANIRFLIERVKVITIGLKQCYDIDLELQTPETGSILDDTTLWLARVRDELSKYKGAQRLSITSKWSANGVASKPNIEHGLSAFSAEFVMDKADFPSDRSLLRGAALEYEGAHQRPITLKVYPPVDAAPALHGAPLQFGRTGPVATNRDLLPQHGDMLWNGPPIGTWKLEGRFDATAGAINNIVLHLWVVST